MPESRAAIKDIGAYRSQGYSDATEKKDRAALKAHWQQHGADRSKETADMTTALLVGEDAATLKPSFDKVLSDVRAKVNPHNDIKAYHAPSIKKASRMYEKAVGYAIEANAGQLECTRIRDILRGTLTFQSMNYLEQVSGSSGNIIDTIEKMFQSRSKGTGCRVIQVKNRFIQGKAPNMRNMTGVSFEEAKKYYHPSWTQGGWRPRDTCYRDIQLLVVLPQGWDGQKLNLKYHIGEIQLTVAAMSFAKHAGGHKYYRIVRNVMEYIEYDRLRTEHGSLNLASAPAFYKQHAPADMRNSFPKAYVEMASFYQKLKLNKHVIDGAVPSCIDNSKWYAKRNA